MSSEKTLRRYVADRLKAHGTVTQLESGATAAGVPDTVFFSKAAQRDVFIELKYGNNRKGFELRKTQIAWMRSRIKKGGHAFLLLKYGENGDNTYSLIKVDSEEKLKYLTKNQSAIKWAMISQMEWLNTIPVEELVEELLK